MQNIILNHKSLYSPDDALFVRNIYVKISSYIVIKFHRNSRYIYTKKIIQGDVLQNCTLTIMLYIFRFSKPSSEFKNNIIH